MSKPMSLSKQKEIAHDREEMATTLAEKIIRDSLYRYYLLTLNFDAGEAAIKTSNTTFIEKNGYKYVTWYLQQEIKEALLRGLP